MRIAIASQNRRTVSAHPGKTRVFLVHTAEMGGEPGPAEVLELPKDGMIHGYSHDAAHPLYTMNVLISKTAGAGFLRRMAARGVSVAITDLDDPEEAIRAYLAGDLAPVEAPPLSA
ncbi:MAG: nitrogen fixation protein [Rhodospirillum sp.]|nr:nitrogen fixation protein [Rhodospirillum sp.]MCF8491251.1 nitrogen fixation protein [Rhodospirillum sp.]MCF8500773.1 nitrogen fixation protein [Rhodospirillum sp.]